MCWNEKKVFVKSLIECSERNRGCVINSRRSNTKSYYLVYGQIRKQVCSKMFLSTLGISENTARIWTADQGISKSTEHSYDKRGKKVQYEKRINFLKNWLAQNRIPLSTEIYKIIF